MKIYRGVTHKVNFGNYEGIEFRASVEVNSEEFPPGTTPADMIATVNERLADTVADDLEEARNNLDPDAKFDSYIKTWYRDEDPAEES